jgi:hypothetical protein
VLARVSCGAGASSPTYGTVQAYTGTRYTVHEDCSHHSADISLVLPSRSPTRTGLLGTTLARSGHPAPHCLTLQSPDLSLTLTSTPFRAAGRRQRARVAHTECLRQVIPSPHMPPQPSRPSNMYVRDHPRDRPRDARTQRSAPACTRMLPHAPADAACPSRASHEIIERDHPNLPSPRR